MDKMTFRQFVEYIYYEVYKGSQPWAYCKAIAREKYK